MREAKKKDRHFTQRLLSGNSLLAIGFYYEVEQQYKLKDKDCNILLI